MSSALFFFRVEYERAGGRGHVRRRLRGVDGGICRGFEQEDRRVWCLCVGGGIGLI